MEEAPKAIVANGDGDVATTGEEGSASRIDKGPTS